VNQHESDGLAAALCHYGWQAAGDGDIADVCIVNTCTVTQKASMQSRQLIRRLQRSHPGARIVVTGCYAQIAPHEIEAIEGVHAIVGHRRKAALPEMIVQTVEHPSQSPLWAVDDLNDDIAFAEPLATAPGRRTRPFLKIQDGCDSFCTYCIVPYARGRSRSMRPEQVLHHLKRLGAMGFQEVVLTGIHLGAYGLDLQPAIGLLTLMERIAKQQPVARIRLSSIEPHELSAELIDLVSSTPLFCPHFHLPLQSGDDGILERMRRPYRRDLFQQQILSLKARLPQAAVGTDVLVGFPGEDEDAFANTIRLLEDLPLSYLHVFPYSRRPGTPAGDDPNQIAPHLIKARSAHIRAIGARKKQIFMQDAVGRQTEVLVETRRDAATGLLKGLTGNYLTVLIDGADRHMNTIVPALLQGIQSPRALQGEILA
jgi:threonylcarbamoyladenosine tRNA methylthiotransferase MtaB